MLLLLLLLWPLWFALKWNSTQIVKMYVQQVGLVLILSLPISPIHPPTHPPTHPSTYQPVQPHYLLPNFLHPSFCSFRLGVADDERAKSEKAYAVLSSFTDAKRSLRIGVLPWGPPGGEREKFPRGGNFITLPEHPMWNIKTGDEVGGVVKIVR